MFLDITKETLPTTHHENIMADLMIIRIKHQVWIILLLQVDIYVQHIIQLSFPWYGKLICKIQNVRVGINPTNIYHPSQNTYMVLVIRRQRSIHPWKIVNIRLIHHTKISLFPLWQPAPIDFHIIWRTLSTFLTGSWIYLLIWPFWSFKLTCFI